jgi:glycerophosphoryl diester phosphodiesterase
VHPFLDVGGPVAIAHRGGAHAAPENTMAAFAHAVELGYRYLETDVHLTRDGVLVAFHDARLDRVTDRTGAIADLGLDEVRAADAGFAFTADGGRSFPFRARGVRVPHLEELLVRWPAARWSIDPKSDACVAPLALLLDRLGAWHRVCVGSFSDARLRSIRMLGGDGRACTSMGPRAVAVARVTSLAGAMAALHADCLQVPLRRGRLPIVTPRFVRAAHRRGLPVHVWVVDDAPTMHRLLDLRVDGIMTDELELLRGVFAARGLPLGGAPTAGADAAPARGADR